MSYKSCFLHNNLLTKIPTDLFTQFSAMSLQLLTLRDNNINKINSHQFSLMKNLKVLDISSNGLKQIDSLALFNLTKLKYLDLAENNLTKVTDRSFFGLILQSYSYVRVDNPSTCCFFEKSNQSQCVPENKKSPYLTCEQLLPTTVVKISTWTFCFCALLANFIVFMWGCHKILAKEVSEKQIIFITNLAMADFIMGAYLLIIASADHYYNEYFPSYAQEWRNSILCKVTGTLSVLSSEASLFFLTLIAIERVWAFRYPLVNHKLFGKKSQALFMLSVWITTITISIITLFFENDKLYQFSDVCIGLPLVKSLKYEVEYQNITISYDFDRDDDHLHLQTMKETGHLPGNYFSIAIFMGLNFLLCLIIAVCYIGLFIHILVSRNALLTTDFKIAIKMGAITLTDLMCWLPISVLGILVQTGQLELSPVWIPWITAFALPINSAINPFIYATMGRVSKPLVDRWQRYNRVREMETAL